VAFVVNAVMISLVCHHGRTDGPACDEDRLCAAVVGLRDVDTWDVRETLRRLRPEALDRLTFVGDGDTPWSQTSHPPFTTLNWNLDQIADLTCGIIRDIEAGKVFKKPVLRLIPPRLMVMVTAARRCRSGCGRPTVCCRGR